MEVAAMRELDWAVGVFLAEQGQDGCVSGDIQRALILSPSATQRILRKLERAGVARREGLHSATRWFLVVGEVVSTQPALHATTETRVRDAAVELRSFKPKDVCVRTGLSPATVQRWLTAFVERGWFTHEPHRPYVYVPPGAQTVNRERHTPPEVAVVRRETSQPKTQKRARSKRVRELTKRARAAGGDVRVSSRQHLMVVDPNGRVVATGAMSPSDVRSDKNLMADARRAGMRV